jgi:chloramphenicol-sensitive protein RarD
MNNGILIAVSAYALWGLLPIYWKMIQTVPALEILCHRTTWSFVFLLLLLTIRRQWQWLKQVKERPVILLIFLGTAALLSVNWFTYIWSVNAGHIVDASLGYFINPLFSVLLGMLFLRERLRPWQWAAVGLAFCGVLYLTIGYGVFPWIALTLTFTFGLYGLLRKIAPLGSLEGLALETAAMSLPAVVYLVYLEGTGVASFGHAGATTNLLLGFSGVATAFPLLLFASAARSIPLATVGILQYIAPTLQFLLGVLVYGESFSLGQLTGFSAVWAALLIYSVESVIFNRNKHVVQRGVNP